MWRPGPRRSAVTAVVVVAVVAAGCGGSAGEFPRRDVTVVVPWEPGGGSDLIARALAPCMKKALGRKVVIQNVTGASGRIGTFGVYDAKPDGYRIGVLEPYTLTIAALTGQAGDRKPERLVWLGQISAVPMTLVVNAKTGIDSLDDLRGRQVSTAVTQVTLAATLRYLKLIGATPKLVFYDGGSETMLATVRGDVEAAVQVAPTVLRASAANPGVLRVVTVLSGERVADLADTPTTGQLGVPLDADTATIASYSYAYAAAPGTPEPVARTLENAIAAAAKDATCAENVRRAKLAVIYTAAAETTESMRSFERGLAAVREDLLRATTR
jgi:tripartite-type tricarboxylate transporter receptor subunit TctC